MDVEFKLIGDLTMRQFSYLFVLGLLAYLSYLFVFGVLKLPVVVFLVLLAVGLAFVPIQERGMDEWIVNFFRAIKSPTQRVWKKEPQLPSAFVYDSLAVVRQEMITLAPTSSRRKLEEYLRSQEKNVQEDPLDIPIKEYTLKVNQAYPNVRRTTAVSPRVGVLVEELMEEVPTELPEKPGEKYEEEKKQEGFAEKELSTTPAIKEVSKQIPGTKVKVAVSKPGSVTKSRIEQVDFTRPKMLSFSASSYDYQPITPNMHSGRKFINLTPSQGELILPIRGERVLRTAGELKSDVDLKEKAKQLKGYLSAIRQDESLAAVLKKSEPQTPVIERKPTGFPISETIDVERNIGKEAESTVDKLKVQNEELSGEIARLKTQIERGKSMSIRTDDQESLLRRLEIQKEKIAQSYSELKLQYQDLQKQFAEKKTTPAYQTPQAAQQAQVRQLTDKPNILSGVVKDSNGKFLSDILLIIKNRKGEAVRAFKTNVMGEFSVATPLNNGTYTIEVSLSNKSPLTFDIIPIEVKGGVIPSLEIVGR